ncbi:SET domain-containing protein SmydA-8-like [Planococcus citri]|uniref:SET domain-containing protein SmydA-8-like n=1 Tax=Planococcus citri TaxID=170843 RepID=UPI0031F9E852
MPHSFVSPASFLSSRCNYAMEKFNSLILRYNSIFDEIPDDPGWKVSKSQIGGKGILATRNFNPGDIIFKDHPLIVGPRSIPDQKPICVGCYKNENLKLCSKGCRLNVCNQCANNDVHFFECDYLKKLRYKDENESEKKIIRVLTPLRCLTFDDVKKEIVNHLHKLNGPQQGLEVELLKRLTISKIPTRDERFMRLCCSVLDANAYEIQLAGKHENIRGLYPMASVMNHSCAPNTRHDFTDDHEMIIKATKVIPAGTEITTTYAPLLLGTPARRHFLNKSKHFECRCSRCKDFTENGTFLSAFKCRTPSCDSILLPKEPLNLFTTWRCQTCDLILTADKVAILQNVIANEISKLDVAFPAQIVQFVNTNRIVATSHHAIVQFKYILLNVIGYSDGYKWSELPHDLLQLKRTICLEILEIVDRLSLGQCQIKEVCSFELQETDKELQRRM